MGFTSNASAIPRALRTLDMTSRGWGTLPSHESLHFLHLPPLRGCPHDLLGQPLVLLHQGGWHTIASVQRFKALNGSIHRLAPIAGLVLAVFYTLWALVGLERPMAGLISALLLFAVRGLAAWAALRTLERIPGRERSAWRMLAAGLLLWVAGDSASLLAWAIRGGPLGIPSLRELLILAGYLAMLAGFATYPPGNSERFGRVREALEVIILGLAVVALAWLLFWRPALQVGRMHAAGIFWSAIFPVLDLTALLLALRQLFLRLDPPEGRALPMILLAFLLLAIGDLGSSYRWAARQPPMPSGLEAALMAGMASLTAGFLRMEAGEGADRAAPAKARWGHAAARMEPLLPFAFTYAVVGYVIFDLLFTGSLDGFAAGIASAAILLLFVRQGVLAGQREMRQYAALLNAAADMAFICDQNGQIRLANPALIREVGAPGEVGGLDLGKFLRLDPDAGLELPAMLQAGSREGWSGEVGFLRADGTTFPAFLSLRPVGGRGSGNGLLAGTAHDLTTIRRREDELRDALEEIDRARTELAQLNAELEAKVEARTLELQEMVADLARLNEELQSLDRLKSEFVALVSHELRAPLTNIRSGIELILETHPEVPERARRSLALVQAETQRLSQFVESILDLSALEAGRLTLEQTRVSLADCAASALEMVPESQRDRIAIRLAGDLPFALGDPAALTSVFFHLLDNAVKYAPEGDIEVSAEAQGDRVVVTVSDRGPGIPVGEREQVFEMFHRLDASDAREIYGHGLGLPMARRLLEAMRGGIRVEDNPDGGTRMIFWLRREE